MRRVVVLVVGLLVLQAMPAQAAPDVVEQEACSEGSRWRLAITDTGDRIKMRFKVYQSPVGHEWHIHFRYKSHSFLPPHIIGHVFFRGSRVASDGGVLVIQLSRPDWDREGNSSPDGVHGGTWDSQTREVCKASVWYR